MRWRPPKATADRYRNRFERSLAARTAALAEEAARRAPSAWASAEEELARGGRDAERNDFEDVGEADRRAAELYRRAREAARSDRLLGEAANARQAALSAGASELAPRTFAAAEEALASGQSGLATGSDSEVGRDGDRAARGFRRAAWIAALADSVRNRTVSVERFVGAHEADLAVLAGAAGLAAPDLQDPADRTADDLERAIRDLLNRNADLEASLRAERATTAQLTDQVASLERALTDSERRYTESRAALLDRQARDARLRETSALFTPEEGEVFLSGDDLVLRLHGLTFRSGSDEVDESMEPLLAKVQRVLLDYSDAMIRIEGAHRLPGQPEPKPHAQPEPRGRDPRVPAGPPPDQLVTGRGAGAWRGPADRAQRHRGRPGEEPPDRDHAHRAAGGLSPGVYSARRLPVRASGSTGLVIGS